MKPYWYLIPYWRMISRYREWQARRWLKKWREQP